MGYLSIRQIQGMNIFFSSWALVFLAWGILINDWVKLYIKPNEESQSHSPWIQSTIWPKGDLEEVRIMLISVLSLSNFHNIFLGLEFTYMITRTKRTLTMTTCLSFFTGIFLLCALLLYHEKLSQGQSVYYSSYKITWNISTAYVSVFFHFASGTLSLLQIKWFRNTCDSGATFQNSARESYDNTQQFGNSIQVISLPETTSIRPSIVHVHTSVSKEAVSKASQIQKRRVTWAL